MNGRVSVKAVTSGYLDANELQKSVFLRLLFYNKKREVGSRSLKCFWQTWHYYTFFSYIFSGNRLTHFIESSHPLSILKVKKLWKFGFLGCFSKTKTEQRDQKNWNFSDKYGMITPGSAIYFLEKSAHASLKVGTDDSFREKEAMKN